MAVPTPTMSESSGSVYHRLTAYLDGDAYPSRLRLTQYDQTLPVIAVSLCYSGQPYAAISGATVSIRMSKPDGTCVYNPAIGISADRTAAYIRITPQMTAAAGVARCVIEVMADGGVAASGVFFAEIVENPVPEAAYESMTEIQTITELAAEVSNAAGIILDAEEAAEAAVAAATAAAATAASDATAAKLSSAIQMGRVTVSGVTSTPTAFSVTFPAAFTGVPHVIPVPIRNSDIKLDAKLRSESASGFTADVWSNSTSEINIDVDWIAIYW